MTDPVRCNYLVIGGDATGCVVAHRLAGVEACGPRPYIALPTIGYYHA